MILRSDFPTLATYVTDIFNEAASSAVAEMVGNKIFQVKETNRRSYDHLILHGLSGIQKVAEGAELPGVSVVQGDSISWVQARYGAIVSVTKDMRIFDLYDEIETVVRSITDDAFYKIDQSMADVLLYGFSSSNYSDVYGSSVSAVGPDGLAVFSASHSNNINSNVFSNIITYGTVNPVLSREAVVAARAKGRVYKDPVGKSRPINLNVLLVAPSKEDEAYRMINSSQISGSFENDINPLKGKVEIVVWEKLETRSDGTDTSAYWFMYDSKRVGDSLKVIFREKPTLDAPEQVYKTKNWDWSIDYYYTLGRGYPAYIFGSNATAA